MFVPGSVGSEPHSFQVPAHVNLIKGLSKEHDITVFSTGNPDRSKGSFSCGNAQVYFVGADYNSFWLKKLYTLTSSFLSHHRKRPFDICHGLWGYPSGFLSVLLGKLLGLKSVVSLQGGETANIPSIPYGSQTKEPIRSLTSWTCRNADALTVLTEFQLGLLLKTGVNREHTHVIPHGVILSQFPFGERPRQFLPPFKILHVGSLNRIKDQPTLLRTIELIRRKMPCIVRIIGADHLSGMIQDMARKLKLSDIEFCGFLPHDDISPHFQWADILLQSSLYEAQGVVVAEAAATGAFICGTRVGLIADLGEKCTVSALPGDFEGLAHAILQQLEAPETIQEKRINAYQWAAAHDLEWTVREFSKIYRRLSENLQDGVEGNELNRARDGYIKASLFPTR